MHTFYRPAAFSHRSGCVVGGETEDTPPSFTPETGGNSDQGGGPRSLYRASVTTALADPFFGVPVDYYAAKTGAPAKLTPDSRRLLFAFVKW